MSIAAHTISTPSSVCQLGLSEPTLSSGKSLTYLVPTAQPGNFANQLQVAVPRILIIVLNLVSATCIAGYLVVSVTQGQRFDADIAFMSAGQVHRSEMSKSRHVPGSWYERILRAVAAHGGTASLAQIYDWMLTHGHLRPRDLMLSPNGRPRYHYIVRNYCRELCEMSELERVGRGIYRVVTVELSDAPITRQGGAMPKVSASSLRDIEIALGEYREKLESSHLSADARRCHSQGAIAFVRWLAGDSPCDAGRDRPDGSSP